MVRRDVRRRLEEAGESLFLVVAPPGFGKTNLLAEWATTTDAQVAWLGCRPGDAEPVRFWSRLIAALSARWPGIGSDAAMMLRRPSWDAADLVASLGHDLADAPADSAAIVIDDCQHAEPSQPALAALATNLPGNVRLVLASQHNPVFSTSRFRVGSDVAELRATDLAFTEDEVSELLTLAGLDLTPRGLELLQSLTLGWPAGLRLAVLALRNADDPNQVLEGLATTTREVSDYLANEVIDKLAPELTEFITTISVLDEFDVELCRSLTNRADADELLSRVVADDLFISPTDEAVERFRFHPMFTAFLRARLKSLGPETFRETHLRALEVLRERGDLPGALHHAVAVGDVQRAATLVVESQARSLEVGDAQEARAVAREWLARFGEASVETDPEHLLQVVLVLTSYGAREAERWLAALDQAHPDRPPHEDALLHGIWADYLLQRGQADRCLEHNRLARQAVDAAAEQGAVFPRLAELALQEAGAHLLLGDVSAAAVALERTSPVPQHLVDEFRVPVVRSWVAFLEGDLALARQALGRLGQAGAEHAALPYGIGRIFENMLRAGVHLEQREFGPASAAFAEAAAAAEINQRPVIVSLVDVWLARLATAEGNHASALASLADARLVLAAPDERVRAQLAVEEFRIAVALQPDLADPLIPSLPATNESRLLQARLLVGRRAWAHAAEILAAVEPLTLRERIQWEVLLSLATQEQDLASAHGHLRTALGTG